MPSWTDPQRNVVNDGVKIPAKGKCSIHLETEENVNWIFISSPTLAVMKVPFNVLFEEHEELLELFAKLKELRTKEEQASSLELQEHATKVMNTLDEGIKELDDLDTFFTFLTQIGQSHKKIPGFKPDYFWVSKQMYCVIS
ncbi:unnamed protein product [Nezara viridula]|uniref:Globin domain-containing protein n=1 Tax=Nezara viridula TaxID=85310 RepID=A0A9P0H0M5_NEZVI|nr:unnamed protein product [Nezara viridula]